MNSKTVNAAIRCNGSVLAFVATGETVEVWMETDEERSGKVEAQAKVIPVESARKMWRHLTLNGWVRCDWSEVACLTRAAA